MRAAFGCLYQRIQSFVNGVGGSMPVVGGALVTYHNGAKVNTSFITNLEDCAFRSAPELYLRLKAANLQSLSETRAPSPPKYSYPPSLVMATSLASYSRLGISFEVGKDECLSCSSLDAPRAHGKAVYGGGFLISEQKTAEREQLDREKAMVWELSERERRQIKALGWRST